MNELRAHTGLRGVAALTVAVSHAPMEKPFALVQLGGTMVDLFFVLSGFILCYVYAQAETKSPRGGWWDFHVARFARIYPLFAVTALIYFPEYMREAPGTLLLDWPWIHYAVQFLPITNWPYFMQDTWNPPAWSISTEYFCYLFIFPLLVWFPVHVVRPGRVLLVITMIQIALVAAVIHPATPTFGGYTGLFRGIGGFLAGGWLYALYRAAPSLTARIQNWGVPLLAVVPVVLALSLMTHGYAVWVLLILWPFVVLGLTSDTTRAGRWLGHPVLHFLGVISYGIYLIHHPLFRLWGQVKKANFPEVPDWVDWLAAGPLLAATIFVAWLSYRYFEMPLRMLLRRWLGRRPPPNPEDSGMPTIEAAR